MIFIKNIYMFKNYQNLKTALQQITYPQGWKYAISPLQSFASTSMPANQKSQRLKTIYTLLLQCLAQVAIPAQYYSAIKVAVQKIIKKNKQHPFLAKQLKQRFLIGKLPQKIQIQDKEIVKQKINEDKIHIFKGLQKKKDTLEQIIVPITQLISSRPKSVNSIQSLNKSLNMLEKYVMSKQKMGFGRVSMIQGDLYLGRSRQVQNGLQIIVPYQQVVPMVVKTPDIQLNLDYLAGKTVNKWNQFIYSENQLRTFMNKISTPQKRIQYAQRQIQRCSKQTWKAQCLASIIYYYYRLPCFRILQNFPDYKHNIENFQKHYQLTSFNPLALNRQQAFSVILSTFVNDNVDQQGRVVSIQSQTIEQTYIRVMLQLNQHCQTKTKGDVAHQNYKKISKYVQNCTDSVVGYYQMNGVNKSKFQKALNSPIAFDLHFVQTFFPSLNRNSYLSGLIDKVITKGNRISQQQKQLKEWTFTIDSSRYPCKDYIFQ